MFSRVEPQRLFVLAGLAAILGAVLRLGATIPELPLAEAGREGLYLTVDVLLILGLFGLISSVTAVRTWLGVAGFGLGISGFAIIRTGARLAGPDTYQIGSGLLGLGLTLIGVALLRTHGPLRLAGIAWISSFAVGLAGAGLGSPLGFLTASLLFCLGFMASGMAMVRPGGTGLRH